MAKLSKILSFLFELIVAILIIGAAVYLSGIQLFGADFYNSSCFVNSTDALPIFTKVDYIIECLKNGEWPSWFPYWYCGSTVSQYYPPLSYIIFTPLKYFLNNDNLCLQIYIYFGLLTGGLGIWYLFRRFIGNFGGILAGILYSASPYFVVSFLSWGVVAQVPIIAIAPWYLICCLNYYNNQKRRLWIAICLLTFIMLLSHVMHGFMIALSVFVTFVILTVSEKKQFSTILMWGIGTGLAAGILGFWWVTGVLPLENPGVPYLDPGSAKGVTATLSWFFPYLEDYITKYLPEMTNSVGAYFPITIILFSGLSYIFIKKESKGFKKTVLMFLFIQTVFTFVFSFGSHLPFYRFIPLARQLVPGRILTQTAIGAAILSAYFIGNLIIILFRKIKRFIILKRIILTLMIFSMLFLIIADYSNVELAAVIDDYSTETDLFSKLNDNNSNFEKGRLAWYGEGFWSMYTYIPSLFDYNIVYGWNIEGTSLGDYLRFELIALLFEKEEYIYKKINDMNVQFCFLNIKELPWLSQYLKSKGFEYIDELEGKEILKRKKESYFKEYKRNTLVLGKSARIFLCDYPWFAEGFSTNPTDYDMDYFEDFDMIYFCEPDIENENELKVFNSQIEKLADKGKKIFVEFGRTVYPNPICGVSSYDHPIEGEYTITSNDKLNGLNFYTAADGGQTGELIGLDDSLYKLKRTTGEFSVDIVGTKKVGNNNVYFIGGPLTQSKSFAFNYYTGNRDVNEGIISRDKIIYEIFESLFDDKTIYKSLDLPSFNTEDTTWRANSCTFSYESDEDKRIMASITYASRWRVYVDDIEIKTRKTDDMIVFDLPSGKHNVKMIYGMTIYGKIGIGITIFSLLAFLVILLLYKKIMLLLDNIILKALAYLEFKRI